jgi:hypothetical protein
VFVSEMVKYYCREVLILLWCFKCSSSDRMHLIRQKFFGKNRSKIMRYSTTRVNRVKVGISILDGSSLGRWSWSEKEETPLFSPSKKFPWDDVRTTYLVS